MQRHLQDARCPLVAYLAVRDWCPERVHAFVSAARTGNDFPETVRIGDPVRVLLGKALVVVLVAVQDQVAVGGIHVFPKRAHS